jgi:uncharacterized membrane-anchored protein
MAANSKSAGVVLGLLIALMVWFLEVPLFLGLFIKPDRQAPILFFLLLVLPSLASISLAVFLRVIGDRQFSVGLFIATAIMGLLEMVCAIAFIHILY